MLGVLLQCLRAVQLRGTLVNTGNDLTVRVWDNCSLVANFSDGPLMYTYRVAQLKLHFGKTDTEGSEHFVDGNAFAAEVGRGGRGLRGVLVYVRRCMWW